MTGAQAILPSYDRSLKRLIFERETLFEPSIVGIQSTFKLWLGRDMNWNDLVGITGLLYALANPVGVIPIFLKLIQGLNGVSVRRAILVASLAVTCFLAFSVAIGTHVLKFFSVGLDDFRIAGGLLALFIAFEMFQAHYGGFMQTLDEKREAEEDIHGIAITPLAFPLLAGPAEMGVMITLSNESSHWINLVFLIACSVFTGLLIALTLWMAVPIHRVIGKTGINVATRVMALIVAAVGVNFIVTGIGNLFPRLVA